LAVPQSFDDGDLLGANGAKFHLAFSYLHGLREKHGIAIIATQRAGEFLDLGRWRRLAMRERRQARAAGRCGWQSPCQPPYAGRSSCGYCADSL
jgi:hypothetical protein